MASSRQDSAPTGAIAAPDRAGTGIAIGRYVVLEEIGRGGMGRVLRAYDPKLQREVALKVVHNEALGVGGTVRLVAEARAMAKLSHPNVVAVYDVVEGAGDRVVLVMEYVPGRSLAAWLKESRTWPEVVACFRQAGRGLAAAHDAGLLHRDFKPDNVLVGDDGRVRVTDFGLAREVLFESTGESQLDASTSVSVAGPVLTDPGAVVGTLPYLSPERLMGGPADTATDQFAFCVSLWEALLHERPFAGASVVELAFAMTAGAPRPSTSAPRIPAWLLDTVARGLASDAAARWPSMQALLAALARDPAARRRRWLQAVGGLAALGVCAGAVGSWADLVGVKCSDAVASSHLAGAWDDARRAEVESAIMGVDASWANDVWSRVEHDLDTYAAAWTQMHVETCEATTVRGEQSAAVMDLRMACLHRAKVGLAAVTAELATAGRATARQAHELTATLRPIDECANVETLQADVAPPPAHEIDAVEEIRRALARAEAAIGAARHDEAEDALATAQAAIAGIEYGPVRTEMAIVRGRLQDATGDYEGAHQSLREAMQLAATWQQVDELRTAATRLVLVVGDRLGRLDEGLRYADVARGLGKSDPRSEAQVARNVAVVLHEQGKYTESEAEHRRALELREAVLPAGHPELVASRADLANVLHAQGRYDEAEAEHRRVLALLEESLGSHHPDVAFVHHNLALDLHGQGRLELAETEHRRALEIAEAALGRDQPEVATLRKDLAAVLQAQGKDREAEAEHRAALASVKAALGPDHPDVADARNDLAIVLATQGKLPEAEAELRAALEIQVDALGPRHPLVAHAHLNLANVLEELERYDEAEAEHRLGLAALEAALAPDHPHLAQARTMLASLLVQRGEIDEARRLAESAWERRDGDDTPPAERAHTAFVLGRALWAGGEHDRAIELLERAVADFTGAGDGHEADAREAKAWLAEHRR